MSSESDSEFETPTSLPGTGGGGGVLPEKLSRGVRPASQNPYPIYDQSLRYIPTLFMNSPKIRNPIYDLTITSKDKHCLSHGYRFHFCRGLKFSFVPGSCHVDRLIFE